MSLFGPIDPMTALGGLFGSSQLGSAAPAYQGGLSQFQMPLGDQTQPATQMIEQGPPVTAGSIEELIGLPQQRGEALQAQAPANEGFGQKVGGFFDNLDQNLQSPSKVLGLGLLSQIDPRLAQGGLLAGGLFGKNKLF